VVWNEAMQGWNVFGFDEVSEALADGGDRFTMDQRRDVRESPELLPAVIEEAMRWSGPVQYTSPRVCMVDTELGGAQLSKGETVFVFLAAANRDPRLWPDPDRFDIHREAKSHVAFGWGPHLCLGAPLGPFGNQRSHRVPAGGGPGLHPP
jgi:Cytochrome P450